MSETKPKRRAIDRLVNMLDEHLSKLPVAEQKRRLAAMNELSDERNELHRLLERIAKAVHPGNRPELRREFVFALRDLVDFLPIMKHPVRLGTAKKIRAAKPKP
jgi:hypothetical protein